MSDVKKERFRIKPEGYEHDVYFLPDLHGFKMEQGDVVTRTVEMNDGTTETVKSTFNAETGKLEE